MNARSNSTDNLLRITCTAVMIAAISISLSACQGGSSESSLGPWSTGPSAQQESGAIMPDDHTVDWMRRHGKMALAQGDDCAVCHGEEDCIDCHVESLDVTYAVHPPNYAVVHASDASQDLMDCTSCHRLDTFCEACHIESGVSPRLEGSPPMNYEFHPPNWLDASAPENHGTMARRDIIECASCHIEQDCVACHRGINPHPPEFRFECRRWLDTNPSPCAQCHIEDTQQLRELCL